jgi:hypothetical protein
MKFPYKIETLQDGRWRAEAFHSSIGSVAVTAPDRDEAQQKLRAEIRFRLEWCPCSGVGEDHVELELQTPAAPSNRRR